MAKDNAEVPPVEVGGTFEERVVTIASRTVKQGGKAAAEGEARARARRKASSGNLYEARDDTLQTIDHGLRMALVNVLRFLGVSEMEAREWCGLAPERPSERAASDDAERERRRRAAERDLDAVDPSMREGYNPQPGEYSA